MLRTGPIGVAVLVVLAAICVGGCGSGEDDIPDPKETVVALFGAMDRDDQAAIPYVLDLEEMMKNIQTDYALSLDSARVFHSPEEIIADLTFEGRTKKRWFSFQRIVNKANVIDANTATVDVTFVDKEASKAYISRFGLHMVNGKWKIYSFNTIQQRPETN